MLFGLGRETPANVSYPEETEDEDGQPRQSQTSIAAVKRGDRRVVAVNHTARHNTDDGGGHSSEQTKCEQREKARMNRATRTTRHGSAPSPLRPSQR